MVEYELGKLIKIYNGKNYSHLKKGTTPVYGTGGIMLYVSDFLYEGKAILLPRKGSLSNIMYSEGKIWTVDTMYYASVNENIANPYYLYRYLTLLDLAHLDSGSTLPSMTKSAYTNLEINLPEITIQNKIANILSSLDSKIELNNKINKELESMAKTLYDYWFVQFDFPDENGKPYKSSGGKMVYSKELKREIPEGWETKKLDDIISKTGTGLNPRDNFKLGFGNNYYVTIKNIEQGKVILDDKCDKVDDEALKIINRRSDLQVGDILFTSIQPVGVTYLIQEQPQNWNINESVFIIRPNYNLVSSDFLFMLLSSDFM